MNRIYSKDPYWMTTKYPGKCAKCGKRINRGDQVFYYPRTKALFCNNDDCGGAADRDFNSCAFDDAQMSGSW